jgi:hypothetical protein
LRQDDQAHLAPIAETQGIGRLVLTARDGLQAAAHHFGEIGRGIHDQRDLGAQ